MYKACRKSDRLSSLQLILSFLYGFPAPNISHNVYFAILFFLIMLTFGHPWFYSMLRNLLPVFRYLVIWISYVTKLTYKHFLFDGRPLEFPTSGYTVHSLHNSLLRWVLDPEHILISIGISFLTFFFLKIVIPLFRFLTCATYNLSTGFVGPQVWLFALHGRSGRCAS